MAEHFSVGFVGAGKVGRALGRYFMRRGLPVCGYSSRREESAAAAARWTGTAALSCYVVAYAWNPLKNLIFSDPLLRPAFSVGILGLVNSFLYALLLIWTVWLLGRGGVRLKV